MAVKWNKTKLSPDVSYSANLCLANETGSGSWSTTTILLSFAAVVFGSTDQTIDSAVVPIRQENRLYHRLAEIDLCESKAL